MEKRWKKRMNNLEKKQAKLEKLREQHEKSKERTERLGRDVRNLEKQIETDIMADIFREGKTYKMTVADWMRIRGEIPKLMNQKIVEESAQGRENITKSEERENEN